VIDAQGNLDRHDKHFAGRSAELCRLREMVALGKVGMLTAINGLDGIGKTTLAIEYSHAFAHEYPGGCWEVRCQGREDLRVALASLAGVRDLEFDFTDEEKRSLDLGFERVLGELKQCADSAKPSRVLQRNNWSTPPNWLVTPVTALLGLGLLWISSGNGNLRTLVRREIGKSKPPNYWCHKCDDQPGDDSHSAANRKVMLEAIPPRTHHQHCGFVGDRRAERR
jgi:hypothetical protein